MKAARIFLVLGACTIIVTLIVNTVNNPRRYSPLNATAGQTAVNGTEIENIKDKATATDDTATRITVNGTTIENIKKKVNASVFNIATKGTSIENNNSKTEQDHPFNKNLTSSAIKMEDANETELTEPVNNNTVLVNVGNQPTAPPAPPPGKIFSCGYPLDSLREYWFPKYHYAGVFYRNAATSPNDILLVGMHGPCMNTQPSSYMRYIEQHFQGKAVFVNGESRGNIPTEYHPHNHLYQVGGPISDTDHSIRLYYAVSSLFAMQPPYMWQWLFDPTQRPQWNGERSKLIYFVSNCQQRRQQAAAELASAVPVDTFGHCTVDNANATRLNVQSEFPELKIQGHPDNWRLYNHYKYCLVMENSDAGQYITEKIVWALLGGCLPIYWGTQEIFDVFNRDAFLFYQPGKTLEEIMYLEKNSTAYHERLSAPILANGNQTIREYFSLTDDIGGGHMKHRIRSMLGLPNQ
jgi:hypothetical protein